MILSETYAIEDCIDSDSLTSNNNKFSLAGSANINYSSNGLSMEGSDNSGSFYKYNGTIPSNCILECDVVSYTLGAYNFSGEIIASHTCICNGINVTRVGTFNDDYSNYENYEDLSRRDAPYHLKIVIDNGTATFFIDGVQFNQRSAGNTDFGLKSLNNRGVVIKNMKIKPL